MRQRKGGEFIIACDMDDVLLVPHGIVAFSHYLGVLDQFSAILKKYKEKKISYKEIFELWHKIIGRFSSEEKQRAIECVIEAIPEEAFRFVRRAKKLGRFFIVSGNDADLVAAVAKKLGVPFFAANKFIFSLQVRSPKKSLVLKKAGIMPDVAISDDPWNEADFFRMSKHDIIMKRKQFPVNFPLRKNGHRFVVETLNEAYEHLRSIRRGVTL